MRREVYLCIGVFCAFVGALVVPDWSFWQNLPITVGALVWGWTAGYMYGARLKKL